MKTPEELAIAHLMPVIALTDEKLRERVFEDNQTAVQLAIASLDSLCWLAGHGHNTTLTRLLERIGAEAKALGYVLIDDAPPRKERVN